MEICQLLQIPLKERRISLAEFHAADEVFTTGTMGELTPVNEIDGRQIGNGKYPGRIMNLIQNEFRRMTMIEGIPLPF
jgi:branched-subunit amino acid aminotransferase/4-amino-4-deoxychorismate lyase